MYVRLGKMCTIISALSSRGDAGEHDELEHGVTMTAVSRYIKNVRRMSVALGPTEERGAALWVGYDLPGVDDDLTHLGLVKADDETAARYGVREFLRVDPETLGVR